MKTVCCFTGIKRLPKGDELERLKKRLQSEVTALAIIGIYAFVTGGNAGFDMLAANAVFTLKKEKPHIKLKVILPCKDYDKNWNESDKAAQKEILDNADEVIFVSDYYNKGSVRKRNKYIIGVSEYCAAYLKGFCFGARHIVRLARRKRIRFWNIRNRL